jgi:archaellum biogenesis protein FlaJ (TadC family)
MNKVFKSLLLTLFTFFALTLISVLMWVHGIVNARTFGIAYLALVALLTYVITRILIKKKDASESTSQISTENIKVSRLLMIPLKVAVVVLPLLLIYGLLTTRGQPLLPRLVGAGVNIAITAWVASILLKVDKSGNSRPN